MKITVIGAGISGLSSAYVLTKAGHDVTIITKSTSPSTTSNKAAAFWFPYHIRQDKRGCEWSKVSYNFYQDLSENKESGVSMKKIIKAIKTVNDEDTSWIENMPEGSLKLLSTKELPSGYQKGYSADVPLIETQIFLPWLMQELKSKNVNFEIKNISSFDEITSADIIINCAGLASKSLIPDDDLVAVRGQVALLEPGNFPIIFLENEKPLYIVPRKDAIIVGGTYEENITDEITDEETLKRILENAYQLYPALKEHKRIGSWAGLRPFRKLVRVERSGNVIHNYGHGGSGFTLSWGCAATVNELVNEFN